MDEIYNTVFEILKKYSLHPDALKNLSPQSHIINDLKINSARIVDIILDVEEKYNINISDRAIEKINTVEDIATHIHSLIHEQ